MWDWLAPALQVGSSLYGAYSANQAAGTAAQAGNNALNLQAQMYNQNRQDLQPWRQAGQQALATMTPQVTGTFQGSPGYQFQQAEGMRMLNNRLAGMGLSNSGQAQRAALQYSQGLAAQDYGNYWNRLAGLAGIGQTATGQGVQAGQQFGALGGQTMQNVGSALASGQAQQANAIGQGVNNLAAWWMQNQKPMGMG